MEGVSGLEVGPSFAQHQLVVAPIADRFEARSIAARAPVPAATWTRVLSQFSSSFILVNEMWLVWQEGCRI